VSEPLDFTAMANAHLDGFNQAQGLRFTRVGVDHIEACIEVGPQHLQAYGIVHGGVHAAMAETLCSVGAAVTVLPQGRSAVGLDNHTSFLRAVREGTLYAAARPVHRGRRTHVWSCEIRDDSARLVATSRVRIMVLEAGVELAGAPATVRSAED